MKTNLIGIYVNNYMASETALDCAMCPTGAACPFQADEAYAAIPPPAQKVDVANNPCVKTVTSQIQDSINRGKLDCKIINTVGIVDGGRSRGGEGRGDLTSIISITEYIENKLPTAASMLLERGYRTAIMEYQQYTR
jgi:hypothetical protein